MAVEHGVEIVFADRFEERRVEAGGRQEGDRRRDGTQRFHEHAQVDERTDAERHEVVELVPEAVGGREVEGMGA